MKKDIRTAAAGILLTLTTGLMTGLNAQNVGADVTSPAQKLDVAGPLKLGTTSTGVAGSIRWNGTVFQVHNGSQWLTFGNSSLNTLDGTYDEGGAGAGQDYRRQRPCADHRHGRQHGPEDRTVTFNSPRISGSGWTAQ